MTGVLKEEGNLDTGMPRGKTDTQPCDHRSRYWSDASTSQGMPEVTGKHQKLEEARNDSVPEPSKRAQLYQCLDFRILVSKIET